MNEIIERALSGEREAFEKIYDLYKNQIYYFCVRLIPDPVQGRELVVETFQCAFDRLDSLESAEQFELWIKNIAAIKCFNYIHKMKPMLFLQTSESVEEPLFSDAELEQIEKGDLDETKSAAVMDAMLIKLDDAQRMTLMFHYYNGLSVGQIAKIMSCSEEMVKQRTASSAERMKITLAALENVGAKLSSVDFRTVLRLMAACTRVTRDVEDKVSGQIDAITGDVKTVSSLEDTEQSYTFESYVSSLDRKDPGELESSVSKYTGTEATPTYPEGENRFSTASAKRPATRVKKPPEEPTFFEKAKKAFRSLTVTQQSLALLAVVVVVGIIVVALCLPNMKNDQERGNKSVLIPEKDVSSSIDVTDPEPDEDNIPVPVTPTVKFTVTSKAEPLTAEDGTVIARASYQCPVVTIESKPEISEKINSAFTAEMNEVLATYSSEEKQAECQLMYSQQAWGEWKTNETRVEIAQQRADDKVVSFEKSRYEFKYGNVYGQTEIEAYCFSTETGDRLKLSDIMSDLDGYKSFATGFVNDILEQKQTAGEIQLVNAYSSEIDTHIVDDTRWCLTDNGIKILFAEGELIDFTLGAQSFEIPYDKLTDFLKSEYILAD